MKSQRQNMMMGWESFGGQALAEMESGHVKPNPAFPTLIMVMVTLPFMLLGWLLLGTLLAEINRHERIDQSLVLFDAGAAVLVPLEQVRDLGVVRFHGQGDGLYQRYASALLLVDELLPAIIYGLGQRSGVLAHEQMAGIVSARQIIDVEPVQADFLVVFDASAVLVDRLYDAMFTELHVADLLIGEPVSANELLLVLGDKVRSARFHAGQLRTLSLYASLGSGFLASGDAGRFDLAWGGLHDDLLALDRQLTLLEGRGLDARVIAELRGYLQGAWVYLERMAEQVLVSDRVELSSAHADVFGQSAMDSLQSMARVLLDETYTVVRQAKIAALRMHVLLLLGLIVLYLLLLGFALMLYRSRYEILRVQTENRTKSQFLARMSHEIRTPLNGVIGLAELLRDTGPTARQRQYIDLIESSGRSLVSLVNDVLDHARIEAGKLTLEHIPFELAALVGECAHIFSLRAQDNDTIIYWSIDPQLPEQLVGDPTRLRQVLINLLSNAVKFTEHGVVEVVVTRQRCDGGFCRVRFEVKDSGIGLSLEEQSHLFDLFSQASPSVARRYGGSGLGLSISRELVQLMGGDIAVRSAKNWGSTFYFELEMEAGTAGPASHGLPAVAPDSILLDLGGQLRRLIQGRQAFQRVRVETSVGGCIDLLRKNPALSVVVVHTQNPGASLENVLLPLQSTLQGRFLRVVVGVRSAVIPEHCQVSDLLACTVFDPDRLLGLFQPNDMATEQHTDQALTCELKPFAGMRVLVAEDNPVNQIVTDGMLKRMGIEAQIVADGLAALQAYGAQKGAFDLILMDLDMPVMDGATSAREIRALEKQEGWPACRMVALSAHVLAEYRDMVQQAGMNGQLVKPVTLDQLSAVLAER